MEVVGYECFANGTVRPAIMPLKEHKNEYPGKEEQFYGSDTLKKRSARIASRAKMPAKR